jgi:hypothetical protein
MLPLCFEGDRNPAEREDLISERRVFFEPAIWTQFRSTSSKHNPKFARDPWAAMLREDVY